MVFELLQRLFQDIIKCFTLVTDITPYTKFVKFTTILIYTLTTLFSWCYVIFSYHRAIFLLFSIWVRIHLFDLLHSLCMRHYSPLWA